MMATYIGNICVICITCITCIFESLFFCLLYLSNYARGRLLCYNCVPRAPMVDTTDVHSIFLTIFLTIFLNFPPEWTGLHLHVPVDPPLPNPSGHPPTFRTRCKFYSPFASSNCCQDEF